MTVCQGPGNVRATRPTAEQGDWPEERIAQQPCDPFPEEQEPRLRVEAGSLERWLDLNA